MNFCECRLSFRSFAAKPFATERFFQLQEQLYRRFVMSLKQLLLTPKMFLHIGPIQINCDRRHIQIHTPLTIGMLARLRSTRMAADKLCIAVARF